MVDHTNSSHDGPAPFRRYRPSIGAPDHTPNGQVMRFPTAAAAERFPASSPGTTRHQRVVRNRWRQLMVNQTSEPRGSERSSSKTASRPEEGRGTQARSSLHSSPSHPPVENPLPHPPMAPQMPQGRPVPGSSQNPVQPSSRRPHVSSTRGQAPKQGANPRRIANKVTPLRRRQPVWNSPAAPAEGTHPPKRDRKPSPRRRGRPAPRPVLLGIQLLIVGTGIATIVGTILSTLKPESRVTATGQPAVIIPDSSRSQSQRQNLQAAIARGNLPLGQELAHLKTDLVALEAMTPGLAQSVFLYNLDTGAYVDLDGSTGISAASTIKVPILVAFLEAIDSGTLRLDQTLTLREDLVAGGSGNMQTHEMGSQYTAWEVATEMITSSDNTATNMMIELLGGQDSLNQRFQAWGLRTTVLRNPLPDLEGTNTTSPMDLVKLMTMVDQGEVLTLRSRDRLFGIMHRTQTRTLIPGGLGDETALVFNKTGDIGSALGDVALVDAANGTRYVLGVSVSRPHNDGRANELIRRIAGRIHEEMNQPVSPVGRETVPGPSTVPQNPGVQPGSELDAEFQSFPETTPNSNGGVPRG